MAESVMPEYEEFAITRRGKKTGLADFLRSMTPGQVACVDHLSGAKRRDLSVHSTALQIGLQGHFSTMKRDGSTYVTRLRETEIDPRHRR